MELFQECVSLMQFGVTVYQVVIVSRNISLLLVYLLPSLPVTCPDLDMITNGMIVYSDTNTPRAEDSTATYVCDDGYDLSDNTTIVCTTSGWSGSEPMCTGEDCYNYLCRSNVSRT